jgi:preprotein translocase SecE subunit
VLNNGSPFGDGAETESRMASNNDQETALVESNAPGEKSARSGFFSVFKYGQGYWTRLGTAIGATVVLLFIGQFIYSQLPAWFAAPRLEAGVAPAGLTGLIYEYSGTGAGEMNRIARFVIVGVVLLPFFALAWWLMNRVTHAQFLIDTDSEMKKVNWATWPELLGSTRVVIFFMLATAAVLFIYDTLYHQAFYSMTVWLIPPDKTAVLIAGFVFFIGCSLVGLSVLKGSDTGKGKRAGSIVGVMGVVGLAAWVVALLLGWFK